MSEIGCPKEYKKTYIFSKPNIAFVESDGKKIWTKGAVAPTTTPIIIITFVILLIPTSWRSNFIFIDKVCFWSFVDVDFI